MQNLTSTQFCTECVSMFGLRIRKAKVRASVSAIQLNLLDEPAQEKNYNQVRKDQREKKIQAQSDMRVQQEQKSYGLYVHGHI